MLISIMHFPMSDVSDLVEKDLSISQKLFMVDMNLVEEVYMLFSIMPFYKSN